MHSHCTQKVVLFLPTEGGVRMEGQGLLLDEVQELGLMLVCDLSKGPALERFLPWNASPEDLASWAQPPPSGQTPAPITRSTTWSTTTATPLGHEFYVEGKGKTTVSRSWSSAAGTDISKSDAWMQVHGEKQEPLRALGWDADLVGYRPFLTHSELEVFLNRPPSELHDLLANVLGLEDLTAAEKVLQAAAKLRDEKRSMAKKDLEQLRIRLAALAGQDERADACVKSLTGSNPARWDMDRALAIATGSRHQSGGAGQIDRLRSLANLTGPAAADVTAAVEALRKAADGITELAGSAAAQARELAALLDAALRHHQAHGDGPCPVCGNSGALTPAWHAATERHRDRLCDEVRTAEDAIAAAKTAMTRSHALVLSIPQPLAAVSSDDPAATALAAEAWRKWAARPEAVAGTRGRGPHCARRPPGSHPRPAHNCRNRRGRAGRRRTSPP